MADDVLAFLTSYVPIDDERAVWANGTMPLAITSFLADQLPPLELVTSVRSIVLQGNSVLVLRNSDGLHIMPGGRREIGETLEETVRREILEESGWTIARPTLLGFRHLRHLVPKPKDYLSPYPDFFWLIYVASATEFVVGAKVEDDYECDATFHSLEVAPTLNVTRAEHLYLNAALHAPAQPG
jgi:8-oxo-dGTP pyrophosphatase MutT (NUDIX family)